MTRLACGIIALLAAGCGASVESDAGIDTGTGDGIDASASEATPEERALCAHLVTLDCAVASMGTEEECQSSIVALRMGIAIEDCQGEYDAWVACATTAECVDGSGVLCPTEYSTLGMCSMP